MEYKYPNSDRFVHAKFKIKNWGTEYNGLDKSILSLGKTRSYINMYQSIVRITSLISS